MHLACGPARFNELALRLNLPLFWTQDADSDSQPDPDEVVTLLFYPTSDARYVLNGRFGRAFDAAADRIAADDTARTDLRPRRATAREQLDSTGLTLVTSDLRGLSSEDHEFAEHMVRAAGFFDALFARQNGMGEVEQSLDSTDTDSASLFRLDFGIPCAFGSRYSADLCAPGDTTRQHPTTYPVELQLDGFCETLAARADAEALLAPATVVLEDGGLLRAQPYSRAYSDQVSAIAHELRAAAGVLPRGRESQLGEYLNAVAAAFITNRWDSLPRWPHDSEWFVAITPDYEWEPCRRKVAFSLTLGRRLASAPLWSRGLMSNLGEIHDELARVAMDAPRASAGPLPPAPYFVDLIAVSGPHRRGAPDPQGWSYDGLPIVISNRYPDQGRLARTRRELAALFESSALEPWVDDDIASLVATTLHEIAHASGPSAGGSPDSTSSADDEAGHLVNEAWARAAELFLAARLRERGAIDGTMERRVYLEAVGSIVVSFVQGGTAWATRMLDILLEEGAVRWNSDRVTADGEHHGAFEIDFDRVSSRGRELMRTLRGRFARAAPAPVGATYAERVPRAALHERVGNLRFVAVYAVRW